jgi:hypothetical protein
VLLFGFTIKFSRFLIVLSQQDDEGNSTIVYSLTATLIELENEVAELKMKSQQLKKYSPLLLITVVIMTLPL